MLNFVWDLIQAHRKALLAALALVLVQVVDSNTADWIVAVVGVLITGATPNDHAASDRIYRGHRR